MYYLVFCDVDETGRIIDALVGATVIPSRQYDFFFFTNDVRVTQDITKFQVDLVERRLYYVG